MLNDIIKSFTQSESNELETLGIKIKNNTLAFDNTAIQIHNISMVTRSEFKNPITLKDIIILGFFLALAYFQPTLGIVLFLIYSFLLYSKYQKHLLSKYFITLNLGSSQNYRLFFQDDQFRNQVYTTIINSFNSKNQNIFIDMSKQEIERLTILESGATQHQITGDHNIIDNKFGNDNVVAFNGDANQNSTIAKDSPGATQHIELPWDAITLELNALLKQQNLSEDVKTILNDLRQASQNKNQEKFTETVQQHKPFFNQEFLQNTLSGTLSGVLTTLLTLPR